MCFAHMIRNAKKRRLNNKDNWIAIKKDINLLQISSSSQMFDNAVLNFIKKWEIDESQFCDYFKKTWTDQHKNWYEGFEHRVPSTNNALESFNGLIKQKYTLRERFVLKIFLFEMVEKISISFSVKIWAKEPDNSPDLWRESVSYAQEKPVVSIVDENTKKVTFYFPSKSFREKQGTISDQHIQEYNTCEYTSFENM